ncbi:MAG: diguanylate cyclase [Acidobacteria bacterium]|nr:diguanylate cyclase [Acidobacteriota bacterium]
MTDSEMPVMDGITLCRLIKGNELIHSTYVIFLSAHGATNAKVTALDVGADDYLVKPADENELRARVRAGLRLQRALAELEAKNELLERLALTDPLTGLANRRAFEEALSTETARATRHGKPLSLLFLDLDHFKDVNDRHGHAVGDEVLSAVSDLLKRLGRRGDMSARIGGEEFAVILPQTSLPQAKLVAERIRAALEASPVGRSQFVSVTTSIGCSSFDGSGTVASSALLRAADEGTLYTARTRAEGRLGRGCPNDAQSGGCLARAQARGERHRLWERHSHCAGGPPLSDPVPPWTIHCSRRRPARRGSGPPESAPPSSGSGRRSAPRS